MPLINGIKMACEPCIRGHRSTKCTHANERLMVPVRKPGRPLSTCPHPQERPCGCGSVIAAIPRKQQCGCGTSAPTPPSNKSRPTSQPNDPTSPTKGVFRVQKPSRPASRKQSLDPASFERAGMKFNFAANDHAPLNVSKQPTFVQGEVGYMATPQYANSLAIAQMDMSTFGNGAWPVSLNGFVSAALPTELPIAESVIDEKPINDMKRESQTPGPLPQKEEPKVRSCCAGKKSVAAEPAMSSTPLVLPLADASPLAYTMSSSLPPQSFPVFAEQPTILAYPSNYGSYQNPLNPLGWQKLLESQILPQTQQLNGATQPSSTPMMGNTESFHSCSCGDGCQCIGCAMHPYNEATQNYVRSAWKLSNEVTEPFTPTNGHVSVQSNGLGHITPPTANTPTSALTPSDAGSTSMNGEEQSLSPADYFFVNYPFNEDSCGGDDASCPCGDDCQCLGCTIHRTPAERL